MADAVKKEGIFDLSNAEGVNESERLLVQLCRRSFLSLWSHANLHTDEGLHSSTRSPKEFSDALVVFGDDVILFSDKHIHYDEAADPGIAWGRWRKRAIDKSVKQIYGALSWLQRFPDRIFLDPLCTRPLPVKIPPAGRARYHLVAVTRGSTGACAKAFPGTLGTHRIDTNIEGVAGDVPFTVGRPTPGKPFVHVFDELALEVVMNEMDTVTDFVEYLRARERFLSDPAMQVMAWGEEHMVAAYLTNMTGDSHYFLPSVAGKPDLVVLDESHYQGLLSRPEYRAKKLADTDSYVWDQLIERFIGTGDPKLLHPDSDQPPDKTEEGLRLIARESRFRRRMLIGVLRDVFVAAAANPGKRRVRIFTTEQEPETVYVFLVMPRLDSESLDQYRQHRAALLHAYVRCGKLRFPKGVDFIGIGLDHPVRDYRVSSEDLIAWTWTEYTPAIQAELEKMREELGILGAGMVQGGGHADEYPAAEAKPAPGIKA